MKLVIKVDKKKEVNRVLAIIQLGLLTALENNSISIEEAEGYIFNPYTIKKMEEINVNNKVIDIVHLGTELEDIKSLIPEKIEESIIDLKRKCIAMFNELDKADIPTSKLI